MDETAQNLLDLYTRSSEWAASKVAGASSHLEAETPCDEWNVRTLLNHVVDTQNYFIHAARGEQASPPSPTPPELVGADPIGAFDRAREEMLSTFQEPGAIERTGESLGIASSDLLLHAWDLAKATHQNSTMPEGLPEAAHNIIHGKFSDDERKGVFKPEVPIATDASEQDKFLAYTGRDPFA